MNLQIFLQNINSYKQDQNREMESLKESMKMSDVFTKERLENLSSDAFNANEVLQCKL